MHYKNGRVANVGDPVVGNVFNNGGQTVAGTLVSVTPGPDSCSAMVGYLITVPLTDEESLRRGYVHIEGPTMKSAVYIKEVAKVQGTEQHGSAGPLAATFYVQDYTECKHLLHADDAHQAAEPITAISQAIDYSDLIDQEKKAHEERRGTSGKSPEYEEGYIKAHDSIKNLIIQAQRAIQLEPGDVKQPPVGNAHVAEGCEQFGSETE